MVPTILSYWDLDVQQGLFKLTMKSNNAQAMAEVVVLHPTRQTPSLLIPSFVL
jgi:hypothetical protein